MFILVIRFLPSDGYNFARTRCEATQSANATHEQVLVLIHYGIFLLFQHIERHFVPQISFLIDYI